jgi:hypothetical protein
MEDLQELIKQNLEHLEDGSSLGEEDEEEVVGDDDEEDELDEDMAARRKLWNA